MLSKDKTSASRSKWESRWSTARPPCSAAAAAICASVSGTPVVAVTALGEFADCAHRGVGDGAIVAQ
jgi:hypothetical protein